MYFKFVFKIKNFKFRQGGIHMKYKICTCGDS